MVWRFYMKMWFLFFQMYKSKREKGKIFFDKNTKFMKHFLKNEKVEVQQIIVMNVESLKRTKWRSMTAQLSRSAAQGHLAVGKSILCTTLGNWPALDWYSLTCRWVSCSLIFLTNQLFVSYFPGLDFCNRNYSNRGIK